MAQSVITLSGEEMLRRFEAIRDKFDRTVMVGLQAAAIPTERRVIQSHMSSPKRGSHFGHLGVDTGSARRSIVNRTGQAGGYAFLGIGSALKHVQAHEEGFHGTVSVRTHMRAPTKRIARARGRALRGLIRSLGVSRPNVAALGAATRKPILVRAHSRQMNISAKHFLRLGIIRSSDDVQNAIVRALTITAETGAIPNIATVLGGR